MKAKRDEYIKRLNGIYLRNVGTSKVEYIEGTATFVGEKCVQVSKKGDHDSTYTADKILIAVGGKPAWPDIPGAHHGINSDGFFELDHLPK